MPAPPNTLDFMLAQLALKEPELAAKIAAQMAPPPGAAPDATATAPAPDTTQSPVSNLGQALAGVDPNMMTPPEPPRGVAPAIGGLGPPNIVALMQFLLSQRQGLQQGQQSLGSILGG